ncbi:hypothetical protein C5616_24210, partial [Vibrio anguillarum]|nr:hypothetical protein [Vibrio anguillarum]
MVINDRGLENEFDYLGVKFRLSNKSSKYSLSTNKVKEIKTRVIKSIVDYRKNKDDELLINRIMFLTSNYKI